MLFVSIDESIFCKYFQDKKVYRCLICDKVIDKIVHHKSSTRKCASAQLHSGALQAPGRRHGSLPRRIRKNLCVQVSTSGVVPVYRVWRECCHWTDCGWGLGPAELGPGAVADRLLDGGSVAGRESRSELNEDHEVRDEHPDHLQDKQMVFTFMSPGLVMRVFGGSMMS